MNNNFFSTKKDMIFSICGVGLSILCLGIYLYSLPQPFGSMPPPPKQIQYKTPPVLIINEDYTPTFYEYEDLSNIEFAINDRVFFLKNNDVVSLNSEYVGVVTSIAPKNKSSWQK